MEICRDQCWASHLPALVSCLLATNGPVLEIGAGEWSTPLLNHFCAMTGRRFVSLESDREWAARLNSVYGRVTVDWCSDLEAACKVSRFSFWSVVFIDPSRPPRRADLAKEFVESAEFIVVHDYADENVTEFAEILHLWKHHRVYDTFSPRTLVLSQREIPA